MKKKIYLPLLVVSLFLCWYFFIKSYDYTITFKSNTFPGAINQTIKLWGSTNSKVSGTKQLNGIENLAQTFKFSDSIHTYNWHIKPITDSTSQVSVGIKDENWQNSFWNKLKVPFTKTNFSINSEKTVFSFMEVLKDHVDNFKVTIVGIQDIPVKHLAYVTVSQKQMEKAAGMMDNHALLNDVLISNNIELDGYPMIEVTQWNQEKDSITFNFCYPIIASDSLPKVEKIQYKKLITKKGIKAIYNGNYITSDRAWYALLNYARINNIKVEEQPVEIFHNNPNMGGNALKWKTEVYLPLSLEK